MFCVSCKFPKKICLIFISELYIRILLIQILISLSYGQSTSDGHCIWYGECYLAGSNSKNCVYNDTAKPLNDEEAEDIMLDLCPHIYKSSKLSFNDITTDNIVKFIHIPLQLRI